MKHPICLVLGLALAALPAASTDGNREQQPRYSKDGRLLLPANYRDWIFLSSGLDMSYTPRSGSPHHSVFDNVFVAPDAYRSFLRGGAWPDKTVLVLEVRGAEAAGSINRSGHFQSETVSGVEVHVKDSAHGGWAFYGFDKGKPAAMIDRSADCYSCHREHGAVDTTFVQFYPTLIPVAKASNTFRMN